MNCEPTVFSKNRQGRCLRGLAGFTLLEILVAIFILSIIIGLIFGSFEGVFSNADHLQTASDLFKMANTGIHRMTMDLEAIHIMDYPRYKPPDIDDEPDIYRLAGTRETINGQDFSRLRFTSLAHLPINRISKEGIAQIVYYIREERDNTYTLRRSDRLYPYPDFEPDSGDPVVCEQVQAFSLVYISPEGEEQEEWLSESDATAYSTPRSIGIELSLGDPASPYAFRTEVSLPLFRAPREIE